MIWAYTTGLDGANDLKEPYIIGEASGGTGITNVEIESSLARRAALEYLEKMVQRPALTLIDYKEKHRCAGVIAYAAYLSETFQRGVMDENRKVLVGLLTEHL